MGVPDVYSNADDDTAWLVAAVSRRLVTARLVLSVASQRGLAPRARLRRTPSATTPPCPGTARRGRLLP